MRSTVNVIGEVNEELRFVGTVPELVPPGKVQVLVLPSSSAEDDAGREWIAGVVREWHDDLADNNQDIYSLADGVPMNESR